MAHPETKSATDQPATRPVPTRDDLDKASWGRIGYLPPYENIPDEFKGFSRKQPYCEFVSSWFFNGRTKEDMARLTAKPGVDRATALAAIGGVLASFLPSHEHKEAAAAYLLSEWFELAKPK